MGVTKMGSVQELLTSELKILMEGVQNLASLTVAICLFWPLS